MAYVPVPVAFQNKCIGKEYTLCLGKEYTLCLEPNFDENLDIWKMKAVCMGMQVCSFPSNLKKTCTRV